jgi:transcription antitermination factor NusG
VPDCRFDLPVVPNWFAVYTSPRHEKRIEHYFSDREIHHYFSNVDIEHYLPLYRAQRKWNNGLRVNLALPLFPGYIFVRIKRTGRVRVLEVPGVLAVVGLTANEMAPLPEAEGDALRFGLHLRQAEPHPLLTVGQRTRIRSGALARSKGIVVHKKNGLHVVLTMDLIMQSVAVGIDGEELEPVDSGFRYNSGGSRS